MGEKRQGLAKKKPVQDFKKKKVKIGHRAAKPTTTVKTSVQTNQIFLPKQYTDSQLKGETERVYKIDASQLLAKMTHSSHSTRAEALLQLGSAILTEEMDPSPHLSEIIPKTLALLNDLHKEVRHAIPRIYDALCKVCVTEQLATFGDMITHSLLAALSDLHRGVYLPACRILASLVEMHPNLLISKRESFLISLHGILSEKEAAPETKDSQAARPIGEGKYKSRRPTVKDSEDIAEILQTIQKLLVLKPSAAKNGVFDDINIQNSFQLMSVWNTNKIIFDNGKVARTVLAMFNPTFSYAETLVDLLYELCDAADAESIIDLIRLNMPTPNFRLNLKLALIFLKLNSLSDLSELTFADEVKRLTSTTTSNRFAMTNFSEEESKPSFVNANLLERMTVKLEDLIEDTLTKSVTSIGTKFLIACAESDIKFNDNLQLDIIGYFTKMPITSRSFPIIVEYFSRNFSLVANLLNVYLPKFFKAFFSGEANELSKQFLLTLINNSLSNFDGDKLVPFFKLGAKYPITTVDVETSQVLIRLATMKPTAKLADAIKGLCTIDFNQRLVTSYVELIAVHFDAGYYDHQTALSILLTTLLRVDLDDEVKQAFQLNFNKILYQLENKNAILNKMIALSGEHADALYLLGNLFAK